MVSYGRFVFLSVLSLLAYSNLGEQLTFTIHEDKTKDRVSFFKVKADEEFTVKVEESKKWHYFWMSAGTKVTHEALTWKKDWEQGNLINGFRHFVMTAHTKHGLRRAFPIDFNRYDWYGTKPDTEYRKDVTIQLGDKDLVSKIDIDKPEKYPTFVPILQHMEVTLYAPGYRNNCTWTANTEELTPEGDVEVHSENHEELFAAAEVDPSIVNYETPDPRLRDHATLVSKGIGKRELTFRCKRFNAFGKLETHKQLSFKIESFTF